MLLPSIDGAGMTLPALREQYRHYALIIRNVCAPARERLRYIDCLFEHLGQPQTVAELFVGLTPSTPLSFFSITRRDTSQGQGRRCIPLFAAFRPPLSLTTLSEAALKAAGGRKGQEKAHKV